MPDRYETVVVVAAVVSSTIASNDSLHCLISTGEMRMSLIEVGERWSTTEKTTRNNSADSMVAVVVAVVADDNDDYYCYCNNCLMRQKKMPRMMKPLNSDRMKMLLASFLFL